jgi:hypothetical protein
MFQITMDGTALGGLGVCIAALASLIWAIRRDPKSGK